MFNILDTAAELNGGLLLPQHPLDLLTLMCVSFAIIIKADCYVTESKERERERVGNLFAGQCNP
jgi:hypothetical protein